MHTCRCGDLHGFKRLRDHIKAIVLNPNHVAPASWRSCFVGSSWGESAAVAAGLHPGGASGECIEFGVQSVGCRA